MKAERVPITPRSRPRQRPTVAPTPDGEEPASIWDGLIARLVHPTKVAIIEALLWVEEPLSATELTRLLADPSLYLAIVSYHAGGLAELGLLEVIARQQAEGAGAVESFYYFASEVPACH
jgi:hypothetical protein